jgi:hypothetical protein
MQNFLKVVLLITFLVGLGVSQKIKTSQKGQKPAKGPVNTENSKPVPDAVSVQLKGRLAGIVDGSSASVPDDHVPCFFTVKQLMDLRPVPGIIKLTEADQSRILSEIVKAIDEADNADLNQDQKQKFIAALSAEFDNKIVGKTPGEALATIMNFLYQIQSFMDRQQGSTAESAFTYDMSKGAAALRVQIRERFQDESAVQNVLQKALPDDNWYIQNDRSATLTNMISRLRASVSSESTQPFQKVVNQIIQSLMPLKSRYVAVNKARSELNKVARPSDINCAYQILDWNEARLLFGRSVANDSIAVQITVRNLNPNEEFIVHNAMLSVDADIDGAIPQYYESIDKLGIEAYNNAGESLTVHGIVGNSISAAAALLSTLQPIVNVDNFSNAVAAFNGGVPNGWAKLAPDHQKEQLLLIANYGFSATDSFKTVVPKSSAATFYTWFPAKPFLEGWWVQDCARKMALPPASGSKPQVGVDLAKARSICNNQSHITSPASSTNDVPNVEDPGANPSGLELPPSDSGASAANPSIIGQWKEVPYKRWSPIANQLFRELSLAIVAGIHVREDSKNNVSISDLKCPKDSEGNLDFNVSSPSGTVICDVSGENLDKANRLRLENAGNLVDPLRPEGVLSDVGSDNASGKVTFNTMDLWTATGDLYNVFVVGKDGKETATGQQIHLGSKPVLTAMVPAILNLSSKPFGPITLSGLGLNKLKNIALSTGSAGGCKKISVSNATQTQATLDLNSAGLTQGMWTIYVEDCTDANKSTQTLTVNQ